MNTNDLISRAHKKVPGAKLDHKNLCMCFISCLYSFPSCFTMLHSLPALKYNCHFSYIILQMVSHFLVSFILPFAFSPCYPIYFWSVFHERYCLEGTWNTGHFVKDRSDSFRVFLITVIND